MKAYPKYKDSGIQWLGQIPEHWETDKVASLFVERREKCSDKDFPALSVSKMGVTPQLDTAVKTDNGDNRKKVCAGDFVVNSRSDRKGSCGVSPLDGSVSLINIVLEARGKLIRPYIHYLLRSHYYIEEYYRWGRGIVADLWTTRYSEMKNIMLPVPPLNEQEKIVGYLDDKTKAIGLYLERKEKELNFVKEYIFSLIYSTSFEKPVIITSWEDCFPKTWNLRNGRSLFVEYDEKGFSNERFLAVTQDRGLIYKDVDGVNFVTAEKKETQKLVRDGQYVISLRSFEGGIEYSNKQGLISPAYTVLQLRDEYNTLPMRMYFRFLFKSPPFVTKLNHISDSLRDGKSIKFADIKDFLFPVPNNRMLDNIMEYVKMYDFKRAAFDKEKILLTEYKQRMIADAVTGAINVQ